MTLPTTTLRLCCVLACAALLAPAANATVLEEFLFDDAAGTKITGLTNSASGSPFDEDGDSIDVETNGLGQLDASLKANDAFGTNYVDMSLINSGPVYGVMELTYDFDPNTLNTSENEEIRLSLIANDPRSTFVTAEFEIQREDDNSLTLLGNGVGSGASDLAPIDLPGLTQQGTPLVVVLAVNLDSDRYQVHYSTDGGAAFTTLGTADLDPSRAVESMRLTLNNDLSQDSVLLDYLAVTDMNPYPGLIADIENVPEGSTLSLLLVAGAAAWRRRR